MKAKRPTSERRAAASRANGAKSRGPVTERGKYNSSLNGRRHGILAHFLVMPGELPELFQEQYDDFMEEHQPRTPTERALVEEMVTSWWRKQRVWGMESARITHQVELSSMMNYAVPVTDPATRTAIAVGHLADSGRSLDLFLRYETRYERQFHRALARLLDLKSRNPEPGSDSDVGRAPSPAADAPVGVPPSSDSLPGSDGNERALPPENPDFATRSAEPVENKPPASQVPTPPRSQNRSRPAFCPAPALRAQQLHPFPVPLPRNPYAKTTGGSGRTQNATANVAA